MKKMKRLLLAVLSTTMAFASVFAATSCKKNKHQHSYDSTVVVEPTCQAEGYTKKVCSCGDEQVVAGSTVAKIDHFGETTIVKYPTANEPGEKKVVCNMCDKTVTVEIDALAVSLPSVSKLLAEAIGTASYALEVQKDSQIVVYDSERKLNESLTITLGEAVLKTQDGMAAGHIKLEMTGVFDGDPAENVALYVYLAGDDISAELVSPNGDKQKHSENVNQLVYTAIAGAMGMEYEQFVSVAYIASEVVELVPSVVAMIENVKLPTLTEASIANAKAVFELFGEKVIVETVNEDKSTTYTVDLNALKVFVDTVKGKTVGQMIDNAFGAGSVKEIQDFLVSLPDLTVGQIADKAIAFARTYGVDVDATYNLINYAIHMANPESEAIAFESLIATAYNEKLGTIMFGAESDEEIAAIKQTLAEGVTMISAMTIDELYNAMMGIESEKGAEFSITANIEEAIATLAGAVTVEVTVDENGGLVAMDVLVEGYGISVALNDADEYVVTANFGAVVVNGIVSDNGIVMVIDAEGSEVAIELLRSATETDTTYTADLVVKGVDYLDASVVLNNNDEIVDANITVKAQTENGLESVFGIAYKEDESLLLMIDDFTATVEKEVAGDEVVYTGDVKVEKQDYVDVSVTTKDGALMEAELVVRDYIYNEATNTSKFGVLFEVEYVEDTLTFEVPSEETVIEMAHSTVDGKDLIDVKVTWENKVVAEGVMTFEDGKFNFDYEIGKNVEGIRDIELDYTVIVEGDTISYDIYVSVDGEVIADLAYSLTVTETANGGVISFNYDITEIAISDTQTLSGKGGLKFTVA